MNQKKIWLGMLVMALALGMTVIGCDNGTTGDNGEELPKSSGINAVSGKTYFDGRQYYSETVFSATADGAASGTYTGRRNEYNYDEDGKYTYRDGEIGTYSWNEETKTITLKPEKRALNIEGEEEIFRGKADYRKEAQAYYDSYKKEVGEEAFNLQLNQVLSYYGLSSLADYINYMLNEVFSNKTYSYSFSTDGTALFLEESLPANKGANELSGQTYYGRHAVWGEEKRVKDENHTYVFTANGYTESEYNRTYTGSYAYDSSRKWVWLRTETIDGKNRAAYYAEQTAPSGHRYVDDNAYRAAETNSRFYILQQPYNSANKTIGED